MVYFDQLKTIQVRFLSKWICQNSDLKSLQANCLARLNESKHSLVYRRMNSEQLLFIYSLRMWTITETKMLKRAF